MSSKSFSITDYVAIVTAISVTVTAITQTYFYFRLDALWLMPLINPSIYLLEVIKVFLFLLIVILSVFTLEEFYARVTRENRRKRKIKISELTAQELNKILIKNRKLYERNFLQFYLFFIAILLFIFMIFNSANFIIKPLLFGMILGSILGCVLIVFLGKDVPRKLKFCILCTSVIFTSIFNAEIKYNLLNSASKVYLVNSKSDFNKSKLIEISQGKVILMKTFGTSNEFTIVEINQIKKISKE